MTSQKQHQGVILVDLDGTLAHYDHWRGVSHIGSPIPEMVSRVRRWLLRGQEVRIFTARLGKHLKAEEIPLVIQTIDAWCAKHIGVTLQITNEKGMDAVEIWDDRAVQVEPNTGRRVDGIIES